MRQPAFVRNRWNEAFSRDGCATLSAQIRPPHQEAVDLARGAAAFVEGPHHQTLSAATIAGSAAGQSGASPIFILNGAAVIMLRAVTRKRFIIFIALLAVVSGWLWWRQPNHWKLVNLPPTATGPWVAFGDSLTEGFGASENGGFPALLGADLGVAIRNFGTTGHTTADGLKRLDEVAALRPSVVLLCLGGNDVLNRLPRDEMLANLRAIIFRLHGEGSFVVLIGIRSASLRDRNEAIFRALARETGCFYIADLLRGVWGRPVLMSDAIHPNDQGYARIAARLAGELRPLLTKIGSSEGAGQ